MLLGTPSNRFPYLLNVAIDKRAELKIFSDDYETRDGSAERYYIHEVILQVRRFQLLKVVFQKKISRYSILEQGVEPL